MTETDDGNEGGAGLGLSQDGGGGAVATAEAGVDASSEEAGPSLVKGVPGAVALARHVKTDEWGLLVGGHP